MPVNRKNPRQRTERVKPRKARRSDPTDGVQEGRVEKRPAVKLRKEKQQKKKKKISTIKTNNSRKDVVQLKRKS